MAEIPQKQNPVDTESAASNKSLLDQGISISSALHQELRADSYLRNQHWLLARMTKADYLNQNKDDAAAGACFGIGIMGGAALLAGETDRFSERLLKINDIPADQIATKISDARLKEKAVYEQTRKELYGKREQLNSAEIKALWERMDQKEELDPTFREARLLQEIPAFFDGIELYQQTWRHPELFTKQVLQVGDAKPAIPLLESHKLEKLGGMRSLGRFTGLYNRDELISYFQSLRITLGDSSLKHPVMLSLTTANHSITIGYDVQKDIFTFINANKLPPFKFAAIEKLADAVIRALFSDTDIAFYTEIFTTGNQRLEVDKRIQAWKNSAAFKDIHQPNEMKVNRIDGNSGSWLFLAARIGSIDEVNRLLNAKADPNLPITYVKNYKINSLGTARRNEHLEVVKALLKAGADPDALPDEAGLTQLFYASTQGNLAMTKALLSHGANPDVSDDNGTPLLYAVYNKNLEMVKTLLEGGANPDFITKDSGRSVLDTAIKEGNKKIIHALLKKHTEQKQRKFEFGLFKSVSANKSEIIENNVPSRKITI